MPHSLAAFETQRKHPAATLGVGIGKLTERQHDASEVRQRDIDVAIIDGRSPLNSTHGASLAEAHLPQDLTIPVRIERVHHARFLTGNERAPAVGERHQNR